MLNGSTRLQVVGPHVAAKVMDGEAIFINLASGMYYSMDEVGGTMWVLLGSDHSLEETSRLIAERYGIAEERAYEDVEALARKLLEEELVQPSSAESAAPQPELPSTDGAGPYTAPELSRYEDMAELFALDPPLPELPDAPAS
ncbi:MAG TPA: PqqD family protein [Gemmatimonadota bacterium]|nr:PqqD family protein [Gemmatimonadota bacterium]